jgi:hypothetical protein
LKIVVGLGVEFVTEHEPCEGEWVCVGGDTGELLEAEESLFSVDDKECSFVIFCFCEDEWDGESEDD